LSKIQTILEKRKKSKKKQKKVKKKSKKAKKKFQKVKKKKATLLFESLFMPNHSN
jgi:hypothetical protein